MGSRDWDVTSQLLFCLNDDTADDVTRVPIDIRDPRTPHADVTGDRIPADDGILFAWGSNEDGQCGLGDAPGACLPQQVPSDGEIVNLSCGYRHTAFVTGQSKPGII